MSRNHWQELGCWYYSVLLCSDCGIVASACPRARVSELTYVTIIGTRYPELDNLQNDVIQFGNYLQAEQCTRGGFLPIFFFFFSLHCRTSARHCRSTTGMSEERKQISPNAKANKNKHTTKQRPQNQTRQRSREICKNGETGETSASLSSPSRVLFRQVVLPHVVHV